jgi:hypothetical protein
MSRKSENLPEHVSRLTLAGLIGLSADTIDDLALKGKIPASIRGSYPLRPCLRALYLYAKSSKHEPAMERLTKAKASREERRDRIEAGEVIESNQVTRAWENIVLLFRQRVLRIGNNIQSKCGVADPVRKAIDEEVSVALIELQKDLNYASDGETEEKSIETLNESAGKSP